MEDEIKQLLCGSGFALLLGLLSYYLGYRRSALRYDLIREVPTVRTRDIPGLGAAMVEVKGIVRAGQPLLSDLTLTPCVAYTCCITEHWTTTRTERDSNGNERKVTEHHQETRHKAGDRIPFQVHDESGEVTVQPAGAEIDLLDGMALRGVNGPVNGSRFARMRPRRWNGYLTYEESVLPVEQMVYVLGEVTEDHTIAAPSVRRRPFVISYLGEDQLLRWSWWGKLLYGVLATLLLLIGFVLLGIALIDPSLWEEISSP